MVSSSAAAPAGPPVALTWAARLCLVLAIAGAGYLSAVALGMTLAAGSWETSQCAALSSGRWSRWLGLPVGVPLLIAYAAGLVWSLPPSPRSARDEQRRAWLLSVYGPTLALASALWLLGGQLALGEPCAAGLFTGIAGALGGGVLLLLAPRATAAPSGARELGRAIVRGSAGTLFVLGAGQLVPFGVASEPRERAAAPVAPPVASAPPLAAEAVAPPATANEPPARLIGLHIGRFVLNAAELPFWGTPLAPYPAVGLFDYTDSSSRRMRPLLADAERRYGGAFATVALPAPLDASCNRHVTKTAPEHADACAYARLALAVWRAKPETFVDFDRFLFSGEQPPPLQRAEAKAESLAGRDALRAALKDPWIDRQLTTNTDILAANDERGGGEGLPHVMLGRVILRGPQSSEALASVLDEFTGRRR